MAGDNQPAPVILDGSSLTLAEIIDVACHARPIQEIAPDSDVHRRVEESASWVARVVEENAERFASGQPARAYYGLNTGFGIHATARPLADQESTRQASRKLVISHAAGVGAFFPCPVVRAAMLIRANTLAKGLSGVRPVVINRMIQMLNRDVTPAVPSMGSLGASGDLAPLAHLSLVLSKAPDSLENDETSPGFSDVSGEAWIPASTGEEGYVLVSGAEAMNWNDLDQRIVLEAKEALALNNGATFSAALAALALHEAQNLVDSAEIVIALTLEALQGYRDAFLPQIQAVRGHPGQVATAANILALLEGSSLADPGDAAHDPLHMPPQDAYSLRCVPQVLGPIRETLAHIREMLGREINAATDNPLMFVDPHYGLTRSYKTISGGNFHGEYLAFAMDHLSIAITELAGIAERRVFWLMNPPMARGLPSMLVQGNESHIDSGLMITQYVAASLVSRCKTLAHPDSVDSIPSSANQEDHVSMSLNAALHARQIIEHATAVVAIEAMAAVQAIRHRLAGMLRDGMAAQPLDSASLGRGAQAVWGLLNTSASAILQFPLDRDAVPYPYLRLMTGLIEQGRFVEAVRQAGMTLKNIRTRTELSD